MAQAQDEHSHSIPGPVWQIVTLANQARADAGAPPLRWDAALATAARQHCQRMVAEGVIGHQYQGEADLSARAGEAGAHFSLIEENVAEAPDPVSIHTGWMHSAGHRSNLLNPEVDRIGVALVASQGMLFAVADYEKAVQNLSGNQVEAAVGRLVRAGGVRIRPDPAIARAYCAQEVAGRGNGQPRFVMRWQDADLTQLPQPLLDRLATGKYTEAAVGSCPTVGLNGTFTAYHLAVLLY